MLRTRIESHFIGTLRSALLRLRNRHIFLLDLFFLSLSPVVALALRLEAREATAAYVTSIAIYTVAALAFRFAIFRPMGLYNRYWRYATVDELVQTVKAVLYSTALIAAVFYTCIAAQVWNTPLPRSIPMIEGLIALCMVGSIRFGIRLAHHTVQERASRDARRVLIVGAGIAGQIIVRELQASSRLGLKAVGFVDDNLFREGVRITGIPILGTIEDIPEIARGHLIDQVVIAMPNAPGKRIREVLGLCEAAGLAAKTVPAMSAIIGNRVSVSQLRNVEIDDLLRREPIQTDIASVHDLIRGKRILVTGAGGSIGSELCRQVLRCCPSDLALLGHGENSIFEIHSELRSIQMQAQKRPIKSEPPCQTSITPIIADIRFRKRIQKVIAEFQPDIIFHAAAHKHVPLMEGNPAEAITNNVFGTRNVLDAAVAAGVHHFVMISTDKAVNPTSVMGASKRMAELLVLRAARETGRFYAAVRFGNVLGSRGSVVPTFRRQIAAGGPVTVSHPDMTRYFMTIPEAVQLTLQAAVLGRGGEVFMLDMGEPVKIVDLARDLIELSGLQVGEDIDIVFTGKRPGEKLFEELLLSNESYETTEHQKIRIARDASGSVPRSLDDVLLLMECATSNDDSSEIIRGLQRLIPEFQPDREKKPKPAQPAQLAHLATHSLSPYAIVQAQPALPNAAT